eukprot:TRINITY_DN60064_c0_g1_i1.p5 TRINITY_DN60064_c0_g1~~TRINITY_DN60064_c0_g1_i1.p5  ORF type:complete len:103 (+),score=10.28 TRINITY_DN60064_c0_g1_i1:630-938(+)
MPPGLLRSPSVSLLLHAQALPQTIINTRLAPQYVSAVATPQCVSDMATPQYIDPTAATIAASSAVGLPSPRVDTAAAEGRRRQRWPGGHQGKRDHTEPSPTA